VARPWFEDTPVQSHTQRAITGKDRTFKVCINFLVKAADAHSLTHHRLQVGIQALAGLLPSQGSEGELSP
jgi:hypothetical protein